jgi:hypothetical protein
MPAVCMPLRALDFNFVAMGGRGIMCERRDAVLFGLDPRIEAGFVYEALVSWDLQMRIVTEHKRMKTRIKLNCHRRRA